MSLAPLSKEEQARALEEEQESLVPHAQDDLESNRAAASGGSVTSTKGGDTRGSSIESVTTTTMSGNGSSSSSNNNSNNNNINNNNNTRRSNNNVLVAHRFTLAPFSIGRICSLLFMMPIVLAIFALNFYIVFGVYFGENYFIIVTFCLLSCLTFLSYFFCVALDPGGVDKAWHEKIERIARERFLYAKRIHLNTKKAKEEQEEEGMQDENFIENIANIDRYTPYYRCRRTKMYFPPRSSYDDVTRRVVCSMDHYCPWVCNTVGFYNRKFFILFCLYASLTCGFCALVLYPQTKFSIKTSKSKNITTQIQAHAGLSLLAFLLDAVFSGVLSLFTLAHLHMASKNQSSIQGYAQSEIFNLGWRKNFKQIFSTNPMYWFIPIPLGYLSGDGTFWETKFGGVCGIPEANSYREAYGEN